MKLAQLTASATVLSILSEAAVADPDHRPGEGHQCLAKGCAGKSSALRGAAGIAPDVARLKAAMADAATLRDLDGQARSESSP